MRKLATLAEIATVRTHPNADSLDLVTIRGWQVVVKRGEFKPGDPCVYVEIDSVLPEWPEFEFLRKNRFRIKTIKLRGELSQGIAFPVSIIPGDAGSFSEDDDLTEVLDIKLYSPLIPLCLAGDVVGKFPSFIPKTDCERIQNHRRLLEESDRVWVATEKVDGSSVSYFWKDSHFGVCSRNWELRDDPNNAYWVAARQYGIEEKLSALGRNLALQGELIGPKIQGNRYKRDFYDVFFFDVYDIDKREYLDFHDKRNFLTTLGLDQVPVIFSALQFRGFNNVAMADVLDLAEGKSRLNDCEREGLVFLPVHEEHDPRIGRVAFKAISNKFLLKAE